MTLVPSHLQYNLIAGGGDKRAYVALQWPDSGVDNNDADAKTAALAACSVSLRALAAMEKK